MDYTDKELLGDMPSDFLPPKVKETKKIGLQYARNIYNAYKNGVSTNEDIRGIIENRRYSEGTYDVSKFQNLLNADEDITALNLDWTPVSVISKFVDILVGNFSNQGYDISLKGVDSKSLTNKDDAKYELLKKMLFKKEIDEPIKQMTQGQVQPMGEEELPENKEELETYMSLSFKQDLEIAMEKAIDYILEINDYEQIQKRVIRDLIENKKAGVRVYYDGNNSIRIRYVDIEYLVHTRTSDPQFGDVTYYGEVIFMTIQEIRRMNPSLPPEELMAIAKHSAGKFGNRTWNNENDFVDGSSYQDYDDYRIEILDFYVKTIDFKKYEKKESSFGNYFVNEKDLNYKIPKNTKKNRELMTKEHEVSYEGLWCCGTQFLISYGRSKNMVSPIEEGEYMPILMPQYIMVSPGNRNGKTRSLVSRMIPHSDKLMMCNLNIQNLLANASPPGLSVDISAMHDLQISNKKNMSPLEMIKLYRQSGVILYNGMGEDGQPRNMRPVEPLSGGISDSLMQYLNIYNQELENIRNLTGLAPVDASTPQKNALIGVQKLAIQQSNNSTRELSDSFVNVLKRVAKQSTRMIQDLANFGGSLSYFENIIGRYPTELLGMHKDKTLAQYGVFVKAKPTEEEKYELSLSIQKAVESQQITIADEITLKGVENLKEAQAFLKQIINRNQAKKMADEQQMYQAKSQADAQASQQASQVKMQLEQAKIQAQIQLEQVKAEIQKDLDSQKFEQQKALKELDNVHKLEQIRASLSMDEEFGVSKAQLNDKPGEKKSLTKVSPAPPTRVTPPTTGTSPSKIME